MYIVEDLDNDTTCLVFVLDNSYKNNNRVSIADNNAHYDVFNDFSGGFYNWFSFSDDTGVNMKKNIVIEEIHNESIYYRSEELNSVESVLDISQNTTIEDQRDEISRAFKRSAN